MDYPEWTVEWMEALRPALAEDGSIFIIIREHIIGDGSAITCTALFWLFARLAGNNLSA